MESWWISHPKGGIMKLFEIKHRFSRKILFSFECESFKDCVKAAIKAGSNLRGSDLSCSDLRGSDLSCSDLSYSNLRGSDLSGSILSCSNGKRIKIKKTPLQILGLQWPVIIFDFHMKIGCEFHSIKRWDEFNNDSINYMGSNALEFWKQNKSAIMTFCEANGRGEGKDSK